MQTPVLDDGIVSLMPVPTFRWNISAVLLRSVSGYPGPGNMAQKYLFHEDFEHLKPP